MTASIEYLIIRALPQSQQQDPKHISGGVPKYSGQHIQMVHSVVPKYAHDALFARHGDEQAEGRLLDWLKSESVREWHKNLLNLNTPVTTRELHRIAEVAVIKYVCPVNDRGEKWTDEWAAKYIGFQGRELTERTWRVRFRNHQHLMESKLDGLWQAAARAIDDFVRDEAPP